MEANRNHRKQSKEKQSKNQSMKKLFAGVLIPAVIPCIFWVSSNDPIVFFSPTPPDYAGSELPIPANAQFEPHQFIEQNALYSCTHYFFPKCTQKLKKRFFQAMSDVE